MTDCEDCSGLVLPSVKMLSEITEALDQPTYTIHFGTCMKLAMETADCPIDFENLKAILENKFGVNVVLGTHTYWC